MDAFHIHADAGSPFFVKSVDAVEPAFIVVMHTLILAIFCVCALTQILKSIVIWNAIQMVDLIFRPFARHIQPREAMSFVGLIVDLDGDMPFCGYSTSSIPWLEPARPAFD